MNLKRDAARLEAEAVSREAEASAAENQASTVWFEGGEEYYLLFNTVTRLLKEAADLKRRAEAAKKKKE